MQELDRAKPSESYEVVFWGVRETSGVEKAKLAGNRKTQSRWWFQTFLFSSLFGEMIQFDQYFSDGLKPPTSKDFHRRILQELMMLMVDSFAGENQWRSKLSGGHSLLAKASNCLHVIKPGYQ